MRLLSNPRASAYLLAALLPELPDNAILVCVVDPGVGSERDALVLRTGGRTLIGPDNGLLAVCAGMNPGASVYKIAHDKSKLSASFHGRDLFAPMASRIWLGRKHAIGIHGSLELWLVQTGPGCLRR